MAEYLIQEETLTGIADSIRSVRGIVDVIPLSSFTTEINNTISKDVVFNCYVGMMPPNNNVGRDGDVFLLC